MLGLSFLDWFTLLVGLCIITEAGIAVRMWIKRRWP